MHVDFLHREAAWPKHQLCTGFSQQEAALRMQLLELYTASHAHTQSSVSVGVRVCECKSECECENVKLSASACASACA